MVDNKLAIEEEQRAANYEAIKSSVKEDVGDDIYAEAARVPASQAARVQDVASGMRRTAVDEVVETEREVGRARAVARSSKGCSGTPIGTTASGTAGRTARTRAARYSLWTMIPVARLIVSSTSG